MSNSSENRKRAFADVVTIDAWHDTFSESVSTVDLHADVVFGTARVGGDAQSPVRFRLSVRRAEIIVIIPDSEPVSVDRKSVSRDTPELEGHLTQVVEKSTQANLKGGALPRWPLLVLAPRLRRKPMRRRVVLRSKSSKYRRLSNSWRSLNQRMPMATIAGW